MNDLFRRHWTSLLGVLFMLCAVAYLLDYTVSRGWVTDSAKIGLGLLGGALLVLAGMKLLPKQPRRSLAELTAGLGFALLYTTFSFAGIYYALWPSMTVFLCMIAVTGLLAYLAFRLSLRLLMHVGLLGALTAPLVLTPETDQVFTLFLYLLVVNIAYVGLSIRTGWRELRPVVFTGTWLLYTVYYFHFDPFVDQVWSLPFRYAVAAFVFYVIAFVVSSWKEERTFDGINLYLGIANGVLFGLWSVSLLDGLVAPAVPLATMGVIYLGVAGLVYRLTGKVGAPVLTKLAGGALLVLVSLTQVGAGEAIKPLLNTFIWTGVALVLLAVGEAIRMRELKLMAFYVWLCVGGYWYITTWDTPRGEWFGVFIPFLNWGALSWELLAAMGFYFALRVRFTETDESVNRWLANGNAVLAHLVVGGLLTVQVQNMLGEYGWDRTLDEGMTLSVVWGIYALLLFLWGAYSRQRLFRGFGSVVLVLVACKTLLFDLSGHDSIYRVVVLLMLAVISFAITWVNNRWMGKESLNPTSASEGTDSISTMANDEANTDAPANTDTKNDTDAF